MTVLRLTISRTCVLTAVMMLVHLIAPPNRGHATEPDTSRAASLLRKAVADRIFPGCSVAVGTSSRILWIDGFGHSVYDDATAQEIGLPTNSPVTPSTIYDLASLSKVVGTTSVVMLLTHRGQLQLTDPVIKFVPAFASETDNQKSLVTVEHLLVHASGLPAWKPFYRSANTYNAVLTAAFREPLTADPGSVYRYSDVGFMTLGEVASRAGQRPLRELERDLIFDPLNMHNTFRCPTSDRLSEIAPTERDPSTGRFIHGVVHDENCREAEGITGHAGLFSNASDLAIFAAELLKGYQGHSDVFPRDVVRQFVARRNLIAGSSRGLGWDTPSGRSSGGSRISKTAFGHTGFTGTSLWIDPARDLYIILLTNRVHPTRRTSGISPIRRNLADAVIEAFDRSRTSDDQ